MRARRPHDSRRDAGATKINMAHKVTLIPGDGIGPEVTQAAVRILEATGREVRLGNLSGGGRGLRASTTNTFPRN